MAKKKSNSWLVPEEVTEKAAKVAIQKTTPAPKTEKKKRGRPAVEKERSVRLVVTDKARNLLKKIAAIRETTMMEAMEEILEREWAEMNK